MEDLKLNIINSVIFRFLPCGDKGAFFQVPDAVISTWLHGGLLLVTFWAVLKSDPKRFKLG